MKVLLDMYLCYNLGDDLFLKIISERYKNTIFYTIPIYKYENYKNVHFYTGLKRKIYNAIFRLTGNNRLSFFSYLKRKSDMIVTLGGSMFIEGNTNQQFVNKQYNKYFYLDKPYYIVGSNFGPYTTNVFYDLYKKIFAGAKAVCFRDSYSYKLFSNLNNTSYAPDVVFSLKYESKKTEKKVVYSIIDLELRKGLSQCKEKYEQMLIDSIKHYQKKNYKIVLMSFCTKEGDMNAINSIINKIDNRNSVTVYEYGGNINEALDVLATSEIIYATRFHATILALLFKKKVLPIIYSDKTLNVLSDMNFKNQFVDIRKLDTYDINYESIDVPIVDIDELKNKANNQFKELDIILK